MARRKIVFVADTQAPYHLPQAVALACAFIRDYKPYLLALGGDMVDFASISKFNKIGRFAPTRVADELAIYEAEVLEPLMAAAGKALKLFIEGNHEHRLTRYVAAMAKPLEGLIDLEDILGCKRHGIEYITSKGGNGIHKLVVGKDGKPKLTLMHGSVHGLNPAKKQYMKWGSSLLMGHTHKEDTHREKKGDGQDHLALASGCLCKDPDWDDIDNYTRGFIAGWYDDVTGEFGLDHVRISGHDHTEIYSPHGEYYATWVQRIGSPGSWIARRRDIPKAR